MIFPYLGVLYKGIKRQASTIYMKESIYAIYHITYLELIKNMKYAHGKLFVFATNHSIGRNFSQVTGFKLINTFPGAIFAQQLIVDLIAS